MRDIQADVNLPGKFGYDRVRRMERWSTAEKAKKENATQSGNPLSIVANEARPNPARRMKMMMLAKANKSA